MSKRNEAAIRPAPVRPSLPAMTEGWPRCSDVAESCELISDSDFRQPTSSDWQGLRQVPAAPDAAGLALPSGAGSASGPSANAAFRIQQKAVAKACRLSSAAI